MCILSSFERSDTFLEVLLISELYPFIWLICIYIIVCSSILLYMYIIIFWTLWHLSWGVVSLRAVSFHRINMHLYYCMFIDPNIYVYIIIFWTLWHLSWGVVNLRAVTFHRINMHVYYCMFIDSNIYVYYHLLNALTPFLRCC